MYNPSSYFRKMRRYAEAKGDEWYILSAKHGLVDPETVLEPYDEFGLSESKASGIADQLIGQGVSCVEIVAGRKYTDPLIPELEAQGIDVINNFEGMRIGNRQKKLTQLTHKLENETLC